jgi:hypothetical protein
MEFTNRFIQAYRQAPWRVQLQWGGLFLLGLVVAVLIASVYLNISAQAATAGLEIQTIESIKENTQRRIADKRNKLAMLTSQDVMEKRAASMGFVEDDKETTTYMVVKDYPGRQPVVFAPPPGPNQLNQSVIKPGYTQSLWEWLFQGILSFSENNRGGAQ